MKSMKGGAGMKNKKRSPAVQTNEKCFMKKKKTILDLETDGYCTYSVLN